ncbi:hypothetical protein A2533_02295 [Candidatus Falkowbacteria bacterium RIFOXYD2_FULL_35_9]|uniref:Uncharacterized protein n=1 Tax=Candidatus Falkowbacteria bacterium RIFOXYC2_FULL_36_12 TaxID=1798002 RepID=A0A1F5SZV3_9BACT|nr:MAG: hypothetical protein A2300_02345 [Candidatus Falkowbacteria bacterium RIFOXYB2_FULL_35_7]OGF32218.1 MAG: hypothetical protein A2478_02745 [Candidatus Falkowbacteria bacterium RIFOXYC2_FULL_36_12]OGF33214.1 MAG: hypothetical protein A2223_01395 [Candidatus Falkowbacteria bacterium RIFOXYA2_FULL_35_8]OGF48335.1 MAG: hypothetical protein A2533_02295 [Candidatus Falkowbacteria bacterium RIFOXYD2_FULL_35_9]
MTRRVAKKAIKNSKSSKKELSAVENCSAESNYFHGLSLFLLFLLSVIFFTFSFLFASMYKETKLIRVNYEDTHNRLVDVLEGKNGGSVDSKALADQVVEQKESVNVDKWQSFSKYGFRLKFPETWTYRDDPYQKRVDFYTDGVVRGLDNKDSGNFYIRITNGFEDSFLNTDDVIHNEAIEIANRTGRKYELIGLGDSINKTAVAVLGEVGFYELVFGYPAGCVDLCPTIPEEIQVQIVQNFEIIK